MAITKQKKAEVLEKLKKIIRDSSNVTFVNFHGLSVKEAEELRKTLREASVTFFVAKKTLAKKALSEEKVSGELPILDGELALSFGADQIAPSREVFAFQKKLENKIAILGGIFEGRFKNKQDMTEIAAIPPANTLKGMFLNVINSPIQGLVVALGKISEKKSM
ncbi:MAG: 50S ribosomal protein L10 [bacterium]|nr:50S ribosomal protein L10 [bacterium]